MEETTINNVPRRRIAHNGQEIAKAQPLRPENLFRIVANNKKKESPHSSCEDLIKLTEKLAEEARNGTLKGLGGFADYEDGYKFGLEGSYYDNPESAALPLMRLERRIMRKIEEDENNNS